MTKAVVEAESSLELDADYMDHFDSDDEKKKNEINSNDVIIDNVENPQIQLVKLRDASEIKHLANMKAPTMIIESIQIGRPLKTLSLIANVAVTIFLFLSICGSNWIFTANFRVGLWEEYVQDINISTKLTCNKKPCYQGYVRIFVVCCTLALIISIIATGLLTYGMKTINVDRKIVMYNIVIGLHIAEGILFLVSLIGYPISFIKETKYTHKSHLDTKMLGIGWSYVMGWLGVATACVSTGLLCFDKNSEEIIFYEKISRNSCSHCI